MQEEVLVWGDKAILDQLKGILGWQPSLSWFRRWSAFDHPNRLPIKRLDGSRLRCANVSDLVQWKEKNIK